MSAKIVGVTSIRPRRLWRWMTLILGGGIAIATGALGTASIFSTASSTKADRYAILSPTNAAPTPTTFDIVPSPVIEPNPNFFVGTGVGSAGHYSK